MVPYYNHNTGYWYIPGCNIEFVSDVEAWEYIADNQ